MNGVSRRERPRSGEHRARWRGKRWFQPSISLLVVGCVVLVAVAYQAHGAVRSHRATADRLLTDYARVAAWNYRHEAERELSALVEHLFHDALHDAPAYREAPPTSLILHAPHTEAACQFTDLGAVSDAARYFLRGGEVEVIGAGISAFEAAVAGEAIFERVRHEGHLPAREGLVGVTTGDRAIVAAYSRLTVPGDTVVYALFFEPAALEGTLRRPLDEGRLLPEPLVAGLPPDQVLSLQVSLPGGGEVFRSFDVFPDEYMATEVLSGSGGTFSASVGVWPSAADRLVIGGLPRSRLPVLLALLALATGLLSVAFLQLRREHELAAMRASFVSSVSHELRTPLALQRVFLDTLRLGRADTEEGRAWALGNIDRETHRLTHLVENVLRFGQAGEGRLELDRMRTDLAEEIARALTDYEPLAADAELRFQGCRETVIASVDRDGFRQVLFNLVENAVKYGPPEQTVTVSLAGARGRAVITVDDEGPGVPAEERARIWEAFERTEGARRSGRGGSGIGLSVVRDLVALHGGGVAIEDAPGGGARFRVELPLADG